jgi:hypothetical protein
MPTLIGGAFAELRSGPVRWFADWPTAEVPVAGSAVYTIWDRDGTFVYVGMSGRSATATGRGLWGRINSHASGRRSGDQFCILSVVRRFGADGGAD